MSVELVSYGGSGAVKIDRRVMLEFEGRTFSLHTRAAYGLAIRQFFTFVKGVQPGEVELGDVQRWRDHMMNRLGRSNATVNLKLAALRSFYEYLIAGGYVLRNPAGTKSVKPPPLPDETQGRALGNAEVRALLAGPDRSKPGGARDYAMMLIMSKMSLRASEVCSLKASSVKWSHARWVLKYRVKRGRDMTQVLPGDVKEAVDSYLRLDRKRRELLRTNVGDPYLFQPSVNHRTLEYNKAISARMLYTIVTKWADVVGIGRVTPHDLRRTAVTRALDLGMDYRRVQMMTGHKDAKTVARYDHGKKNLELGPASIMHYDD